MLLELQERQFWLSLYFLTPLGADDKHLWGEATAFTPVAGGVRAMSAFPEGAAGKVTPGQPALLGDVAEMKVAGAGNSGVRTFPQTKQNKIKKPKQKNPTKNQTQRAEENQPSAHFLLPALEADGDTTSNGWGTDWRRIIKGVTETGLTVIRTPFVSGNRSRSHALPGESLLAEQKPRM